jgi:multiple sugar transport system substrate-binding protein
VGELPAKPSAALTEQNASNEVFGPFIKGLEYAHTTIFANESGQRQIMVDMISRTDLEDQSLEDSLAEAAEAEQKLLDEYYQ